MATKRSGREMSRAGMPKLGAKIGGGGNGVVRALADVDSVVCKELTRNSKEGRARFTREVTILQAISHPGVIAVLDSNVATATRNDVLWFTMPRARPFPDATTTTLPERIALLAQVAATLADLAAAGIHHRDIKPSNLLYLAELPVVADFGLVTGPDDLGDLTVGRPKLGSNFYVPSELINEPSKAAGAPADVYSFGKTIWVVLSGKAFPPNQVGGAAALNVLLPNEQRLSEIDALLRVMTAEDPTDRPSMAAVAGDLAAWVSAERGGGPNVFPDLRGAIESAMIHVKAAGGDREARRAKTDDVRAAMFRLAARCEDTLRYLEDQGAPVFRRDGTQAFQYDGGDLLDIVNKPAVIQEDSNRSNEIRVCVSSLIQGTDGQPSLRHFVGIIGGESGVDATFVAGAAITYWGGPTVVLQAGARTTLIGGPGEAAIFDDLSFALADRVESDIHNWRDAIINPRTD